MKRVLVIGSVNKDLTIVVDKAPNAGESIISLESRNSLGGKGANQAVALSRLEMDTAFICKIGEDNNGYEAVESLRNDGIFLPLIMKSATKDTGIAIILLEKNGQNRIVVNPGANDDLNDDDFSKVAEILDGYDYYLIQLEVNIDFIKKIIVLLNKMNKYIILNPAPSHYLDDDLLKKVNLVIPNEHEFSILTASEEISDILTLKKLVKEKAKKLGNKWLVTLGDKGSIYIDSNLEIYCPAEKAEVIDTTAAGDTYIAAFVKKYSETNNIEESMKFATKASSITISRKGAQSSIPYLSEIK